MAANLRQIADDLAEALQAHEWTAATPTIERRNWAAADVEQMAEPLVFIVPGGVEVERIGRVNWQNDYTVNVFVGHHVSTDADVEAMYDLADELVSFVRSHSVSSTATTPQTVTIEINPDDAMNDRNVWRAAIAAVYRVVETDS